MDTTTDTPSPAGDRKPFAPRLLGVCMTGLVVLLLTACSATDKALTLTATDAADVAETGETTKAADETAKNGPKAEDMRVAAAAPAAGEDPVSQPGTDAQAYAPPPSGGQTDSVVMQANGLNATSNSIFSSRPVATGDTPSTAAAPNSLYKAAPAAATSGEQPPELPLKPLEGADAGQAASGRSADTEAKTASAGGDIPAKADAGGKQDKSATDSADTTLVAAGLFRTKRRVAGSFEKERFGSEKPRRSLTGARSTDTASLAYNALPGVSTNPLFSMTGESELDALDDHAMPQVEVASLSGLARLAPNGLMHQTASVDSGCFKPRLMGMLKQIEQHYGRKVMVTSGYRPLQVNARVGGSRASRHMSCEAADIQVDGVSKWDIAKFVRSMPGRGGVGTYCHTESVHVDIGPSRDWNWRCRRGKS
ncbi:YcbK family protein [Ensifer soli]|uniref:YcbK family protein n=1 Tax=Ciceribacter sp. sgz301302 TaxID=3342379 RepID=UPI0035B968BE